MRQTKLPNSRLGWHEYYVKKFNKEPNKYAGWLADWYLLLYLAFGED